jgi:hypothetical protein
VTKIQGGIPYVRHYINSTNSYYEEPINNISQFAKYKVDRIKRPDSFKDIEISQKNTDSPYFNSSAQENRVITSMNNDKVEIQKKLRLEDTEYNRLSELAYGVIGAESDFGQSKSTVLRMGMPDFILEAAKSIKGSYNKELNPLSKGYSSIKESALFNISDDRDLKEIQKRVGMKGKDIDGVYGGNTKKAIEEYNIKNPKDVVKYKTTTQKLKEGDYEGLSKLQNYTYAAMNDMGIGIEDLEDPKNAYKATMAILSKVIKANPNATDEDILKAYTGKKSVSGYKQKVDNYKNNLDTFKYNDVQPGTMDKAYGILSNMFNTKDKVLREVKSSIVEQVVKNTKILPINIRALAASTTGANFEITEKFLSSSAKDRLKQIVKNNVKMGKFGIEYGDYGADKFSDVGANTKLTQTEQIKQALTDEGSMLKQFLGQATIVDKGNGIYEVVDSYDFNNAGESFGVMDDLSKKRSLYAAVRSIGTNYGAGDGRGNKVKITIDLNR